MDHMGYADQVRSKIRPVDKVREALPHDLVTRFEYEDLERALVARNGNVMEATALLQKYAHVRLDYPQLYEKMTTASVDKLLDHVVFAPLSGLKTKKGLVVSYYDVGSWDPAVLSLEELTAAFMVLADLGSILKPETLDPGYVVLLDMHAVTMKQMKATTPRAYGRACHCMFESTICHQKKSYYINYNMVSELAQKAMKPFLPKAQTDNMSHIRKEKLIDLLGEEAVEQKRYIPTAQDVDKYKQSIRDNLPMIMAKYNKIML